MMSRILYFVYYLKQTEWDKLSRFLTFAQKETGWSRLRLLSDVFQSVFRYNISIADYFYFRFYCRSAQERAEWAGTGFMYEYQKKMNPAPDREILSDKIQFMRRLKPFVKRAFNTYDELKRDPSLVSRWLDNELHVFVLKNSKGQVGAEVLVSRTSDYDPDTLMKVMKVRQFDLIEEFVVQHPALMELSPAGLNTVRIITQIHGAEVTIIAARLRISVNSPVDNMAAGNLAAPVDVDRGVVSGPGVYSDITRSTAVIHPVTGVPLPGFQIPFWQEASSMVKAAAKELAGNRSVGWDVAITQTGPLLIEGNHNWCKLLWQLPVARGLKSELEVFCE